MIVTRIRQVHTIALSLSLLAATDADAVTVCYPRDQMLSFIMRDYQATEAANGIMRPFSIMELWVTEGDGDWVIVTTDLDGNSCILAYGEEFSGALAEPIEQS